MPTKKLVSCPCDILKPNHQSILCASQKLYTLKCMGGDMGVGRSLPVLKFLHAASKFRTSPFTSVHKVCTIRDTQRNISSLMQLLRDFFLACECF